MLTVYVQNVSDFTKAEQRFRIKRLTGVLVTVPLISFTGHELVPARYRAFLDGEHIATADTLEAATVQLAREQSRRLRDDRGSGPTRLPR